MDPQLNGDEPRENRPYLLLTALRKQGFFPHSMSILSEAVDSCMHVALLPWPSYLNRIPPARRVTPRAGAGSAHLGTLARRVCGLPRRPHRSSPPRRQEGFYSNGIRTHTTGFRRGSREIRKSQHKKVGRSTASVARGHRAAQRQQKESAPQHAPHQPLRRGL